MTADPSTLAAAQRLATSCQCMWSAEDRNVVIDYLRRCAILREEPAPGFPFTLQIQGNTYVLVKPPPQPNPAESR